MANLTNSAKLIQEMAKKANRTELPEVNNSTVNFTVNGNTGSQSMTTNQASNSTVNLTVTKATVGLGNVDNTSDANKPISTATQAALDLKADKSDLSSVYKYKGSVASYSNLPSTGLTAGDVYNVEDTGMNYAWTGSAWDALGSTVDLSNYLAKDNATAFTPTGDYNPATKKYVDDNKTESNVKVFETTNSVVLDGGMFSSDSDLTAKILEMGEWLLEDPNHIAYIAYNIGEVTHDYRSTIMRVMNFSARRMSSDTIQYSFEYIDTSNNSSGGTGSGRVVKFIGSIIYRTSSVLSGSINKYNNPLFVPSNSGTEGDVITKTANGYMWAEPSGTDYSWVEKSGNSIELGLRTIVNTESNITLTVPSTIKDGEEYALRCVNVNSYTLTLGTGFTNPFGVDLTLSANATDQFVFLAVQGTLELQPQFVVSEA